MNECRVLVVDDDPFILTSLVNALENRGIVVAGRAATVREALEVQRDIEMDVALLDLDLGVGPNGIDLAHALRATAPDIGLVLLSSYRDPRLMTPGMLNSPRGMGFLSKTDVNDFTQVVVALRRAAASPMLCRAVGPAADASLTDGQLEVLHLVAQGLSSQAIADVRGVSLKAIEQTISRLGEILGLERRSTANRRVLLTLKYLEMAGKIENPAGL